MTPILESTLTCPDCGTQALETMPTDACLYFYTCTGCGSRLKPKHGDCCVFCSYGSVPCPPIQMGDGNACCAAEPTTVVPEVCSLQPAAFYERMAEIAALMQALRRRRGAHAGRRGVAFQDGRRFAHRARRARRKGALMLRNPRVHGHGRGRLDLIQNWRLGFR